MRIAAKKAPKRKRRRESAPKRLVGSVAACMMAGARRARRQGPSLTRVGNSARPLAPQLEQESDHAPVSLALPAPCCAPRRRCSHLRERESRPRRAETGAKAIARAQREPAVETITADTTPTTAGASAAASDSPSDDARAACRTPPARHIPTAAHAAPRAARTYALLRAPMGKTKDGSQERPAAVARFRRQLPDEVKRRDSAPKRKPERRG